MRQGPGVDGAFSNLHECGRCRMVSYCSVECQKMAWKRGHRFSCCNAEQDDMVIVRTVYPKIDDAQHGVLCMSLSLLDEFGVADSTLAVCCVETIYAYMGSGQAQQDSSAAWILARRLHAVVRVMTHLANIALRKQAEQKRVPTELKTVQSACCQLLRGLSGEGEDDDENDRILEAMFHADCLSALRLTMQGFPSEVQLFADACHVIAMISIVDAALQACTNQEREGGSIAANVIDAMHRLREAREAQVAGLGALRNIATADCAKKMGKSIKHVSGGIKSKEMVGATEGHATKPSSVVAAGGVEVVLRLMREFEADADLIGVACQCIINICNSGAAAIWAVVEKGVSSHLVHVLERWHVRDVRYDPQVVTGYPGWLTDKVSNALDKTLSDLLACKQALGAGIASTILRAIKERLRFPDRSQGVHVDGHWVQAPSMGTPMPVALLGCFGRMLNAFRSSKLLEMELKKQILLEDPELASVRAASALALRPKDKELCDDLIHHLETLRAAASSILQALSSARSKDMSSEEREQTKMTLGYDPAEPPTTQAQAIDAFIHLMTKANESAAEAHPSTLGHIGDARDAGVTSSTSALKSNVSFGFESLCAHCGATANSRCSRCKLVRYCGRDHQQAAWAVHRHTCGQPLPTHDAVGSASLRRLLIMFEEFGKADVNLARLCVKRVFEVIHSEAQLAALEAQHHLLERLLVATMGAHRQDEGFQAMACTLLGMVVDPEHADALSALLNASRAHPRSAKVAECAMTALKTLAKRSPSKRGFDSSGALVSTKFLRRMAEQGCGAVAAAVLDLPATPGEVRLGDASGEAKKAALQLLSHLSHNGDDQINCMLVRDGAIEAAVRVFIDSAMDQAMRDDAKSLILYACIAGDGHHEDGSSRTPAMRYIGATDEDHCVKLALAAGCPRKLWKELRFVHDMMERDGEDTAED